MAKEKNLTAVTSVAAADFARVVTSAGASVKATFANIAKYIIETYNGSTVAGSAQSVKSALDSLNSKTFWVDHTFTGTQITAGTPGTRALQMSIDNPDSSGAYITGIVILYISDSNGFFPVAFRSSNKIYCNFYRASGSAVGDPEVQVRICYTKV